MAITRSAHAVWSGDLFSGAGTVTASSSGAYNELPVSWKARSDETAGPSTSPEELVAAAHASCFCMALSARLGADGKVATRLEADATVTFELFEGGAKVASSALKVVGEVPDMSEDDFRQAAEDAKNGCPISTAMAGNVELSVEASLA